MKISKTLMMGAAAIALVACGDKDSGSDAPQSETSRAAAKLSSASPLDQKFTLKGGEEADIDALLDLLPGETRPTYESATFDAGLGATVINDLRFADSDDGEALIIERTEVYGFDEAAVSKVQTPHEDGAAAPFERVVEKIRFLNISTEGFSDDEASAGLTIAGLEVDALSVRAGGGQNPAGEDGALALNAFSLGGLYFKDIDLKADVEDTQNLAFSAPDLRFVGVAGGQIDAILAKNLNYNIQQGESVRAAMRESLGPQSGMLLDGPLGGLIAPEKQRASIESLEWRDIDFSGLVEYGVKGEEPPVSDRDLMDLGTMKMTALESFVDDRRVAVVGEATVSAMKFAWLIPTEFRLDAKDAVTDYSAYVPDQNSPAYTILKERGLDNVPGDGFVEWAWNPDKGDGALDYVSRSEGFADMTANFEISGMTLDDIGAAVEAEDEAAFAEQMELKSFSLTLDDETALDTIFALAALQMGGTGEDLRQSAPALIRLSGAQFGQLSPRIRDYVEALATFVAEGGSLEIAARPAEPLSPMGLQEQAVDPTAIPDVMNLTVTHSK